MIHYLYLVVVPYLPLYTDSQLESVERVAVSLDTELTILLCYQTSYLLGRLMELASN